MPGDVPQKYIAPIVEDFPANIQTVLPINEKRQVKYVAFCSAKLTLREAHLPH